MSPSFSTGTVEYNVTFPAATATTNVSATSTDPDAQIVGTGTGIAVTNNGTIQVTVTAENRTTKKIYTATCIVPEE